MSTLPAVITESLDAVNARDARRVAAGFRRDRWTVQLPR